MDLTIDSVRPDSAYINEERIDFIYYDEVLVWKNTSLIIPKQDGYLVYDGNSLSPTWTEYRTDCISITVAEETEPGYYYAIASITKEGYKWEDGTTEDLQLLWEITLPIPTVHNPTYDGTLITPYIENYYSQYCSITGTDSGIEKGDYSFYIKPKKSAVKWEDGTTGAKLFTWSIIDVYACNTRDHIYIDFDGTYKEFIVLDWGADGASVKLLGTENISDYTVDYTWQSTGTIYPELGTNVYTMIYTDSYLDNCCLKYYNECPEKIKSAMIAQNTVAHLGCLGISKYNYPDYAYYGYRVNNTNDFDESSSNYTGLIYTVTDGYTDSRYILTPSLLDLLNALPLDAKKETKDGTFYLKDEMYKLYKGYVIETDIKDHNQFYVHDTYTGSETYKGMTGSINIPDPDLKTSTSFGYLSGMFYINLKNVSYIKL